MGALLLCTDWPQGDVALMRGELELAGVEVRLAAAPCGEFAVDRVVLSAMTQLQSCTAEQCTTTWELPSSTAAQRREAISHVVESVRARLGRWQGAEAPVLPSTAAAVRTTNIPQLPAPIQLAPAEPVLPTTRTEIAKSATSDFNFALGPRVQAGPRVLGAMLGLEAAMAVRVTKDISLGLSAAALTSPASVGAAAFRVHFAHVPVLLGGRLKVAKGLSAGGWAGVSLLYAGGQAQGEAVARSGWALAARAELRMDGCIVRRPEWSFHIGARGGVWLTGVEVATQRARVDLAVDRVRGGDVGFVVSVGTAGW
jgi:hypothetical protein